IRPARVRPRTASTARFTSSKTSARVRAWSSFDRKSIDVRVSSVRLKTLLNRARHEGRRKFRLRRPVPVNTTGGNATGTFMREDIDAVPKPTATVRIASHGRPLPVRARTRPQGLPEPPVRLGSRNGPPGRSRPAHRGHLDDPLRVPQLPHGHNRRGDELVLLGHRLL